MKINNMLPGILILFALVPFNAIASSIENEDIWFFVLVKSNNYSQDQDGNLKLLNFHFFSELFGKEPGKIKSATLARTGSNAEAFVYEDRGEAFYYEGGHYNTVDAEAKKFFSENYLSDLCRCVFNFIIIVSPFTRMET